MHTRIPSITIAGVPPTEYRNNATTWLGNGNSRTVRRGRQNWNTFCVTSDDTKDQAKVSYGMTASLDEPPAAAHPNQRLLSCHGHGFQAYQYAGDCISATSHPPVLVMLRTSAAMCHPAGH